MKKSCFVLLTAVVALCALTVPALAMDVDELIDKHLEASGGKDKLEAVKSTQVTGKFMTQGMEFPFTMTQKRPNYLRIEAEVMGMSMIQAFDGEKGWSINPMMGSTDPQPMGDFENKSFKLQADMEGMMAFKEKGYTMEYLGEEDVEGTPCHRMKVDTHEDIVIDYFFDAEYFLIVKQATTVKMDEQVIESQTYPSDYQDVNGLIMPFSIETRMGDMVANSIVFEKVEHNIEVDDSQFMMPEVEEAPGAPSTPDTDDGQ
jgi:outer membrane lipoprotein-sorting protein